MAEPAFAAGEAEQSSTAARGRGRPRSERSKAAILAAAGELLLERGLDAVSMDAIAERAGVSKATIYRWWPTKETLAIDALYEDWEAAYPVAPDTGRLRDDLRGDLPLVHGLRSSALDQHQRSPPIKFTRRMRGCTVLPPWAWPLPDSVPTRPRASAGRIGKPDCISLPEGEDLPSGRDIAKASLLLAACAIAPETPS